MILKTMGLLIVPIEYDAIVDNAVGDDDILTTGEIRTIQVTVYV